MLKPELPDPPKITIEELLRFKRAERPAPEFWTRFESELRRKQLAALVEKESWWRSVPRFFMRFSRLHVPIGATAILALSMVTLRTYQSGTFLHSLTSVKSAAGTLRPALADAVAVSADRRAGPAGAAGRPALAATFAEMRVPMQAAAPVRETSVPASAALAPQEIAEMIPWLGAVVRLGASDADTPSARTLPADFAVAESAEPESAGLFGRARAFEARALSVHAESLVSTATVSRRAARLIMDCQAFDASYVPTPAAPEPVRARIARYLVEDGFEQTSSRLGAQGDRVSFKF